MTRIVSDAYGTCGVYGRNGPRQGIACLGGNTFGQLNPSEPWRDTFTGLRSTHANVGQITALAMNEGTGCLIVDGTIKCWGEGRWFKTGSSNVVRLFE